MEALSQKDKKIYQFISESISENGYPPSVRDILTSLGIKSTSTVHASLCRLESAGLISRDCKKSRSIQLAQDIGSSSSCKIPVLSKLKNAIAFDHDYNVSAYIDFALPDSINKSDVFAYKISGDGVPKLGIFDGDYIIIFKTDSLADGDIAALANGGKLAIVPYPSSHENSLVLGKVIASVKYF